MNLVKQHAPELGVAPLCAALGISRATYYRSASRRGLPPPHSPGRPSPARRAGAARHRSQPGLDVDSA